MARAAAAWACSIAMACAKSDTEGFIAVAPDGLPTKPHDDPNFLNNPNVWNAGQLRPGSHAHEDRRRGLHRRAARCAASKVPYDANRVFCAGHSNGATMTMRLGAELSDRLTAIGTVAGLLSVPAHPKRPLPTLLHLRNEGSARADRRRPGQAPLGHARQHPPVATPLAALATAIGCSTDPQTVSDPDGLKKVVYRSNSAVQHSRSSTSTAKATTGPAAKAPCPKAWSAHRPSISTRPPRSGNSSRKQSRL